MSTRVIASLTTLLIAAVACVPEPPGPEQSPVVASFDSLGAPHVAPALVPLRWQVSDPQGDPITCRLDGDGDGVWDHTFDPCPTVASRNATAVATGSRTARLEVSDGTHTTLATEAYTVDPSPTNGSFDIVIRPAGAIDADVLAAFDRAAARWEEAIVSDVADLPVTLAAGSCGAGSAAFDGVIDDLVVNLSLNDIPPPAWAAPCVYGLDRLPRLGYVEVDPELLQNLRTLDVVDEVALHEIGHVLGFGLTWFALDHVEGAATADPRFTGPRAVAEASALGFSGTIPLMTINGVLQPHWESAFFGPEIMASVPNGSALSRMTLAALADSGYTVDLDAADPYTPPLAPGTCVAFTETFERCW